MSFVDKLLEGIVKIGFYVSKAIAFLTEFNLFAPSLVTFIIEGVRLLMDAIANKEIEPGEAREDLVVRATEKFSGSDPMLEQNIRMLIEAAVIVEKAKRGYDFEAQEVIAIEKGYLIREEIERARKVWPGLLPVD